MCKLESGYNEIINNKLITKLKPTYAFAMPCCMKEISPKIYLGSNIEI